MMYKRKHKVIHDFIPPLWLEIMDVEPDVGVGHPQGAVEAGHQQRQEGQADQWEESINSH